MALERWVDAGYHDVQRLSAERGGVGGMEGAAEALALEISGLRAAFADIDGAIEKRRPIVVFARKPSDDADAMKRLLGPLLTQRDERSDWQAMRDSWRLRHFSTCFGLVNKSGYRWSIDETEARIAVIFEPGDQPA